MTSRPHSRPANTWTPVSYTHLLEFLRYPQLIPAFFNRRLVRSSMGLYSHFNLAMDLSLIHISKWSVWSLGIGSCYIGDVMERCEEHRAMPVSYTHLDVYKRQVQRCAQPADE